MMSLQLVLSIIAMVCAIIAGIFGRGSTVTILLAVAVALLALVHILTGGLVVR